jgi:hypothetical protein
MVVSVLLGAVFLLSGGPLFLQAMVNPIHASYVRWVVSMPFFFGFVWFGFIGLLYTWRNSTSIKCLLGFVIAFFSYIAIETLFNLLM